MRVSRVELAKRYECGACGVYPGEECWPRHADDVPWVHKARTDALDLNMYAYVAVPA